MHDNQKRWETNISNVKSLLKKITYCRERRGGGPGGRPTCSSFCRSQNIEFPHDGKSILFNQLPFRGTLKSLQQIFYIEKLLVVIQCKKLVTMRMFGKRAIFDNLDKNL